MPKGYRNDGTPLSPSRNVTIPATPEQVARFGHIAIFLRRYFTETGMGLGDFNEHVLLTRRSATAVSSWRNAKMAPGRGLARQIENTLKVPRGFFSPADIEAPAPEQPTTYAVPASWMPNPRPGSLAAAVGPQKMLPPPQPSVEPPRPATRPLVSFHLNDDGTARLTVDVTLDTKRATSLFRVLLEAGLEDAAG